MRLSTYKDDPGFCPLLPIDGIEITLDGFECKDVVMADEEAGEILRSKRNANGDLYLVDDENIAMEVVRGKVVIKVPENFPSNPHAWYWKLLVLARNGAHRFYVRNIYYPALKRGFEFPRWKY